MSFPWSVCVSGGWLGGVCWAQAGLQVCWHQLQLSQDIPPGLEPSWLKPGVNLHSEAQNEGRERTAEAAFHRGKGFLSKDTIILISFKHIISFQPILCSTGKDLQSFCCQRKAAIVFSCLLRRWSAKGKHTHVCTEGFQELGGLAGAILMKILPVVLCALVWLQKFWAWEQKAILCIFCCKSAHAEALAERGN